MKRRPETGDDEEGIVDADTEPDECGQARSEVGKFDPVGQQVEQREGDAEREQRGDQRETHRNNGSERDQQDDDGNRQADALGPTARSLDFAELNRSTARLDLQSVGVRVCDQSLQLVQDVVGKFGAALIELHRREADRALL